MKVECFGGPLDGSWIDWPEDPDVLPPLGDGFYMRSIREDGAVEMYKAVRRGHRFVWERMPPHPHRS